MPERLNYHDVTILFALRVDHPDRVRNLNYVYNFYKHNFKGINFVVAHDRVDYKYIFDMSRSDVLYVRRDNKGPFSKAWCYNTGFLLSKTPYIMVSDVDVIITKKGLDSALESIHHTPMIMPYNGVVIALHEQTTSQLDFEQYDYSQFDRLVPEQKHIKVGYKTGEISIQHTKSPGGVTIFTRKCYNELGGYNPQFRGWGYEDDEILVRAHKLDINPRRVVYPECPLWHLFHKDAQKDSNPFYKENKNVLDSSVSKNVVETKQMISNWNVNNVPS